MSAIRPAVQPRRLPLVDAERGRLNERTTPSSTDGEKDEGKDRRTDRQTEADTNSSFTDRNVADAAYIMLGS